MNDELERMKLRLMDKQNVVASGIGFKTVDGKMTDEIVVVVSVTQKVPKSQLSKRDLVPETVDGYPTDVVETGPIRALSLYRDRYRPCPAGVSIGHRNVTAGTFGCVVESVTGERFILSNNHVLANSNDCELGDIIVQPGTFDGGFASRDTIGHLAAYAPIRMLGDRDAPVESTCPLASAAAAVLNKVSALIGSGARLVPVSVEEELEQTNLIDAALARPVSEDDLMGVVFGIGPVAGMSESYLGMQIKKSGRTTGKTEGQIIQTNVTVDVDFGDGRMARFTDQFMSGAMSAGGDSGSVMLDEYNNAVGLLFAGSDTVTISNRFWNVVEHFRVAPVIG